MAPKAQQIVSRKDMLKISKRRRCMLIDHLDHLQHDAGRAEAHAIAAPQLRPPVHALLVDERAVAAEILDAGDSIAQQQRGNARATRPARRAASRSARTPSGTCVPTVSGSTRSGQARPSHTTWVAVCSLGARVGCSAPGRRLQLFERQLAHQRGLRAAQDQA